MRDVRRKHIAMIFQDPSNFLNPIMRDRRPDRRRPDRAELVEAGEVARA